MEHDKSMDYQKEKKNLDSIPSNSPTDNSFGNSSGPSSFFVLSAQIAFSKYLRWLTIALLPILIILIYQVDRVDTDLWWQMAYGKYYIAHHTLRIDPSIFSWTPIDPTVIYNTCLGSIIVYVFYNLLGGFGLWLMQSLVFLGIFVSFFVFLRVLHQRLDLNSVTVIAAIGIACFTTCRFYKPELFSALLFCWTIFIFFYIKITRRKMLFYLYPLIFVFWVNLHGGVLVGMAFLVIAFSGELLNRIFFSRESFTTAELVHFGTACFLSFAAMLINPYGSAYLSGLFPTVMNALSFENYSGPSYTHNLSHASLWQYLNINIRFFHAGFTSWIMTLMMLSILLLTGFELIKKKSFDFAVLLISCALYWKGMNTIRASYFFPIFFFFGFFYLLIHRLALKRFLRRTAIFALLIYTFFFISILYFNIRYAVDSKWFGQGLDNFVPVEEVAFLKKYKLDGLILNDYAVGGYLIWDLYPDYKVFIDPRGAMTYKYQVLPDYLEFIAKHLTIDDIRRFTDKYPFKIVILSYHVMPLIFDFLRAGDNEWHLVYFEKNAVVLIHKSLYPRIRGELHNVNLSPYRFSGVRSPETLLSLFNLYVHLNPHAGQIIYDIFKKNVSNYHKQKIEYLNKMEDDIRRKKVELQNK